MNFFHKFSKKNFHFFNIHKQVQLPSSFKSNPNQKQGFEHRVYISNGNEIISFWHDINLVNLDKTYKIVVEIPKGERAKMEMAKNEVDNPIRFDYITRDEQHVLRFFGVDPTFNIGFFPQTWENPHALVEKEFVGDDDPLDCLEIGKNPLKVGEVVDVYILGAFCVVDNNEADWKIVVINRNEAESEFLDYYLRNYDEFKLKYIYDIMDWYKTYKKHEGSENGKTIYREKFYSKQEAEALIVNSHENYLLLKDKKVEKIDFSKYNFDI
jgi:inorganic pyrophosphatase